MLLVMSDKKFDKYKMILLDYRKKILRELQIERGYMGYTEQGDLADIADTQITNDLFNTLSDLEQEKLKEIDIALEKIENGTFGICEGTGKKIPDARLQHIPWTRYSVEHAQFLEHEKKMSGGSSLK